MKPISIAEITHAVSGECNPVFNEQMISSISTDSRKINRGDLYIALIGENFDGHDFIKDAVRKGAGAIVSQKPVAFSAEVPLILVHDTLQALGLLASYYRRKLNKSVVGVTGSVGKTSTKEMISTILSGKLNIHKSLGNFNNEIGMPLTIFGLQDDHDVMVLEMGMWAEGEIRDLVGIAKPSIGAITNIGLSHIERLGSQENILKAKLEIVEGIEPGGLLILNGDDSFLSKVDGSIFPRILWVGIDHPCDLRAQNVIDHGEQGMEFDVDLYGERVSVHLPAIGRHNVLNALIGIACAIELGLTKEEILRGIGNYHPEKMRQNIVDLNGIRFIDDTYNASPDSMVAGLKVLKSLAIGRRAIALLGNMFELGHMASIAHKELAEECCSMGLDYVGFMGENSTDFVLGMNGQVPFQIYESHEEMVFEMKKFLHPGDVVLLKGSRGMKMERIIELWKE